MLSVLASDYRTITVSIVDNGSSDGSCELIENGYRSLGLTARSTLQVQDNLSACVYQDVHGRLVLLVDSQENLGFAGGNRLGMAAAESLGPFDYVWFLNNDTEVKSDCLSQLVKRVATNGTVGICGATLIYFDDQETVQCFGGSSASKWTGLTREIGNGLSWPCDVDVQDVEARMACVAGASMLVTRKFLDRVGSMADDYFIFYEEWDWAVRARRAGFRLAYAREAVVYHRVGASIGTGRSTRRSALAEYYGVRNKLRFTWRFYPWALPTVWLVSWLQVLRRLWQREPDRALLIARVLLGLGSIPEPR